MNWRSLAEDEREQYGEYCDDMLSDGKQRHILTFEDWLSARGEAAFERLSEAYYGGESTQTEAERSEMARRENIN